MATINLTVYGHEITCTNEEKPVLSQGSHNIDTVIFTYDSTYSGYTLYATMYQSMSDPVLVELSNNSCKIPIDALLYPGKVRIGLRAENSDGSVIATSCLEWFNVEPGAIDGSEGTSTSGIASLVNRIAALESAISGGAVPTEVRQAIFSILNNNAFANNSQYNAELAVLQSWATEVMSIAVSPTTLSMNGAEAEQLVATTQPAGGLVTWESSDTSVADVDAGLVTSVGNGTCTITARCGSKTATCAVTVSGFATLLSIDAVYTQTGTVYDTDSLDSLRSDLVVTGTWSDERTLPITDYTLSGTLTEGTSTIVVAYGGKTDTFDVTVVHELTYVQDGLIMWLDGEKNSTGGTHATSLSTWVDQSGNGWDWTNDGNATINEQSVGFNGSSTTFSRNSLPQNVQMIEVVLNNTSSGCVMTGFGRDYVGNVNIRSSDSLIAFHTSAGNGENTNTGFIFGTGLHSANSGGYLDGEPATLVSTGADWQGTNPKLGAYRYNNSNSYYFTGEIYCIRLYSRILTEEEILSNFATDRERFGIGVGS